MTMADTLDLDFGAQPAAGPTPSALLEAAAREEAGLVLEASRHQR